MNTIEWFKADSPAAKEYFLDNEEEAQTANPINTNSG
tara:strand:- start:555 stop:665 length:111 start_codon:yes stop_codon:yes gene_type:complete